jgi:hypothetical protein
MLSVGRLSSRARSFGPAGAAWTKGCELGGQDLVIGEGIGFGLGLQEEVEGVDDGHVGHEVHGDGEFAQLFWENDAGLEIALAGPAAS